MSDLESEATKQIEDLRRLRAEAEQRIVDLNVRIGQLEGELADARNLLLNAETLLDPEGGMAKRINRFLDKYVEAQEPRSPVLIP